MRFGPPCLLASALALTACQSTDPYVRPGQWRPLGANSDNLAAMVANPRDLLAGHGQTISDGQLAADAVTRLRDGTVRPLPNTGVSQLKINDFGNSPSDAAAGAGAGGAAAAAAGGAAGGAP